MKVESRPKVITTITSFGTKLRVISLIEVAAWMIPMIKPTISATASNGTAANIKN